MSRQVILVSTENDGFLRVGLHLFPVNVFCQWDYEIAQVNSTKQLWNNNLEI